MIIIILILLLTLVLLLLIGSRKRARNTAVPGDMPVWTGSSESGASNHVSDDSSTDFTPGGGDFGGAGSSGSWDDAGDGGGDGGD